MINSGYLLESVCEDLLFEGKRHHEQAAIERAQTEFDADAMATTLTAYRRVSVASLVELTESRAGA